MLPEELLDSEYYILCEGNFGQANASLWSVDENFETVSGPHIWNTNTNPLGDVGQSMTIHEDNLYLIMNNSHEIKVVNLENGPSHVQDIELPDAGPRYMAIQSSLDRGFVSCWKLAALLIIDLNTNSVVDTVQLNAMPEELIIDGDQLYVSMTMNTDWSANDQVLEFDISGVDPVLARNFTVLDGPGSMALADDMLYVTSLAYDASWAAVTGTSSIDLVTGIVTTSEHGSYSTYNADIDVFNNEPYRVYGKSIVFLNSPLLIGRRDVIIDLANIYSFSFQNGKAVVGTSDYAAPDSVHFFSDLGILEASIAVAGFPRDVKFYNPNF